jgi:glycosyltransferase involved in cell wall biosynthesis
VINIFVDASNIHTGGGKTLLNDFLLSAKDFESSNFQIWVDRRYQIPKSLRNLKHISFEQASKIDRIRLKFSLKHLAMKNDIIIYFGNIPPFNKPDCRTILMQNNRFVIDSIPINDSFVNRARIEIERFLFKKFKNNVKEVIIQSTSMKFVLDRLKNNSFTSTVMAFKSFHEMTKRVPAVERDGFIYVSSDDPHKNHQKLFDAWILLAQENIYPNLKLTLPKGSKLTEKIHAIKSQYSLNIEVLWDCPRAVLLSEFSRSKALVFPSLIESYGLPLVEARMLDLDILAPELDYVRDVVDPIETFDPGSALSICRAIKRYLHCKQEKTDIIDPNDFIAYLIK